MKKFIIIAFALMASLSLAAQNNVKLKVEGPEASYNLVRVENHTDFSNFELTVYTLNESDGKFSVKSTLGSFSLKEKGDIDSVKTRVFAGQWLGVAIPEGMEKVKAVLIYKDLPMFDIVYIVLTEENAPAVGEEF